MPRIHPKPDVIDRMLELLPELRMKVLRHLCDCPTCHALWLGEPLGEERGAEVAVEEEGGRVLPWRPPMAEYGAAIDRVLRDVQVRFEEVERERAAAPVLLEELKRHPHERRSWWMAQSARFQTLPVVDLVLRTADEEVFRDARDAERWAELALDLADRLDPRQVGMRVIEDARARCWSSIANARRVASDLLGSEQAFRAAEAHLRLGSRDPLVKAGVLERKASLRRAQSRFSEAISLLKRSISIWLSVGERSRVTRAVLVWESVCSAAGDFDEAFRLLSKALRLADSQLEPRLRLLIRHNLIDCLTETGRLREARALLARSRSLYRRLPEPGVYLRERWMEARILYGSGQPTRAIRLLARVRDEFAGRGDAYEAALVTLELAAFHARLGQTSLARRLAGEALPLFHSRGVQRETLAALILLLQPPAA